MLKSGDRKQKQKKEKRPFNFSQKKLCKSKKSRFFAEAKQLKTQCSAMRFQIWSLQSTAKTEKLLTGEKVTTVSTLPTTLSDSVKAEKRTSQKKESVQMYVFCFVLHDFFANFPFIKKPFNNLVSKKNLAISTLFLSMSCLTLTRLRMYQIGWLEFLDNILDNNKLFFSFQKLTFLFHNF